jgi:hypothetical protein
MSVRDHHDASELITAIGQVGLLAGGVALERRLGIVRGTA